MGKFVAASGENPMAIDTRLAPWNQVLSASAKGGAAAWPGIPLFDVAVGKRGCRRGRL